MTSIYNLSQEPYKGALTVYPKIEKVYNIFQYVLQSVADNHLDTTLFGQAKTLLKELEEDGINRYKFMAQLLSRDLPVITKAYSRLSTRFTNESLKKALSRLHLYEKRAFDCLNAINELGKVSNCINEINQALTILSINNYFSIYTNRIREIGVIMDEIEKLTISITISFSEVY